MGNCPSSVLGVTSFCSRLLEGGAGLLAWGGVIVPVDCSPGAIRGVFPSVGSVDNKLGELDCLCTIELLPGGPVFCRGDCECLCR